MATNDDQQLKTVRAKELHSAWVKKHGLVNHNWDDQFDDKGKISEDNSDRRGYFVWFVEQQEAHTALAELRARRDELSKLIQTNAFPVGELRGQVFRRMDDFDRQIKEMSK